MTPGDLELYSFIGPLYLSAVLRILPASEFQFLLLKSLQVILAFLKEPIADHEPAKATAERVRARGRVKGRAYAGRVDAASLSPSELPPQSPGLRGRRAGPAMAAPGCRVFLPGTQGGRDTTSSLHQLSGPRDFGHLEMWLAGASSVTQRNHAVLLSQRPRTTSPQPEERTASPHVLKTQRRRMEGWIFTKH